MPSPIPTATRTPAPTPTPFTPLTGVGLSVTSAAIGSPDVTAAPGTTVTVRISATNTTNLAGVQLQLRFDSAVVRAASVAQGGVPAGFLFSSGIENDQGFVNVVVAGASAANLAGFAVADVTFDVVGATGTSTSLTLANTLASDDSVQSLSVSTSNGAISVHP